MISADTNVVLRYLLLDHEAQHAEACELFEAARAGRTTVLVSSIAICETVWVLRAAVRMSRTEISGLVGGLLDADGVVAEDPDATRAALAAYADGGADVADVLIRERSRSLGATAVATFDAALLALEGFVRPRPSKWPDGVAERPRPWRRRTAALRRPRVRSG